MTKVLFAAGPGNWETYRAPLDTALSEAGIDAEVATDMPPGEVEYIVYAPSSAVQDFRPFTRLKAVLNLWAGVEGVVGNTTLKAPLARMVDPAMTEGMVEFCTGHVLRHHLDTDRDVMRTDRVWSPHIPPLARERGVTVLGLGALGSAVAGALAALNFRVTGWSRRPKSLPGVRCLSGDDGLAEALASGEIVVLLVPLTAETEGMMNAARLALLPRGATILNPGRGALIDDEALLAALETGQVGHATLDVFRSEPLPPQHPYWAHPRVTVTPHVASATRPPSASRVIAENIRRGEAGEPFLYLVDRSAGY